MTGEIGLHGKVLVIRRIRAHYRLRAGEEAREVVERVHSVHRDYCPVARSLKGAIEISTSYELVT